MQDLLVEDGDIAFEGGDLVLGYADLQHQQHLLQANKGEYKKYPELGVGIINLLLSENATAFMIEAKRNFEYDRMAVKEIRFTEDNSLIIDAFYKNE